MMAKPGKSFFVNAVCLVLAGALGGVLSGCEQYVYWDSPYGYEGSGKAQSKSQRKAQTPAPQSKASPTKTKAAGTLATSVSGGYRIKPGDTLFSIARKHDVELRDIIEENHLKPPFLLHVGEAISIPKARYYTVHPGDTLYAISRAHGADVSRLSKINELKRDKSIVPGQKLRLPAPAFRPKNTLKAPGKEVAGQITSAQLPFEEKGASQQTRKVEPGKQSRRPVTTPPPPRSGSRFSWPVKGRITSPYGPLKGGRHNDGINIHAQRGTSVKAAENGVVVYAGNELQGFGNLILIKHAGGWTSAYAHNDKILVRRGQKVKKGEIVSKVGSSGNVSAPQLHFELRKGSRAVDPSKHLS